MDVYIDIVYFVNCVMGMFCILSLSLLIGKVQSIKSIILLSLFWGFHILSLYSEDWLYYAWVVILCLFVEKKHLLRNFFIYLFLHETYLNSLSGVYRIGNVLVLSTDFNWIPAVTLGFIILFIYTCFWFHLKKEAQQQALFYEVIVKIDQKQFYGIGFMDTGNQALYEGLPIIFSKNKTCFSSSKVPLFFLNHKEDKQACLGSVFFKRQWHPCYVVEHENLEVEADFLLNYYLL